MPLNLDKQKKETILRSLKTLIVVLAICLGVWIWGNHKTVDVDLQFTIELKGNVQPQSMELTFYNSENEVDQEMTLPITPTINTSNHKASFKPGNYRIRGMVTTSDGENHVVEQTITVPDDDSTMVVYLRNK